MRPIASLVLGLCLAAPFVAHGADAFDFTAFDPTGDWYVLLRYTDDRSEEGVQHFKDFAWHIEKTSRGYAIDEHPYVIFDEQTEEQRRAAMRGHTGWIPEGLVLERLHESVDVASRATRTKRVSGSLEKGFKSGEAGAGSGAMSMTFSRDWTLEFSKERLRVQIIDSLSGSDDMLGEMEEAIVYELDQRVSEREFTGPYREGHKKGTVTLIRADQRTIVK